MKHRAPSSALLSEKIRALIEDRKKSDPYAPASDAAIAKRLGLSSNTVGRTRRGDGGATLTTLDAFAQEFNVPSWMLLMTPEEQAQYERALKLLSLIDQNNT